MLPDIRPGNTKILYFFNCLLDGMHTILENFKLDKQTSHEECREFVEETLSEEEEKAIKGIEYYAFEDAVFPGVELNLSYHNAFSYAGTVSSNGNENEVPYNTKTKLVQK